MCFVVLNTLAAWVLAQDQVPVPGNNQPPLIERPIADQEFREDFSGRTCPVDLREHFIDLVNDNDLDFRIASTSAPVDVFVQERGNTGKLSVLCFEQIGGNAARGSGLVEIQAIDSGDRATGINNEFPNLFFNVAINGQPTANDDQITADQNTPTNIPVLDNDQDPENRPLIISLIESGVTELGATLTLSDNQITYDPTIGLIIPVGVTTVLDRFRYQITDELGQTSEAQVEVTITINNPSPPNSDPDPQQEVPPLLNLAQKPLELGIGVESNILVIGDDSGSMDFDLVIDGGVLASAEDLFREPDLSRISAFGWEYLYPYANQFTLAVTAPLSNVSDVVPSQELLEKINPSFADQAGVWRVRHHQFNTLYYDPEVNYLPWAGINPATGRSFDNSDPENARFNPRQTSSGINLTQPQTYTVSIPDATIIQSGEITPVNDRSIGNPRRLNDNPRQLVTMRDYYIPRYYIAMEEAENAPLAPDAIHTLVEIRPGDTYLGSSDRADCAVDDDDPLTCSYEQELQNFANWFTYHRRREFVLKAALGQTVTELNGVRLGYDVLNQASTNVEIEVDSLNMSNRQGHKFQVLNRIYNTGIRGRTPLRRALVQAGNYFACQGTDSFVGGGQCPIFQDQRGQCQQNYTVLFTDGLRNDLTNPAPELNNADSDGNTQFDAGAFADNPNDIPAETTLADIAMHFYETDLQPGLADRVPVTRRDINRAPISAFNDDGQTMHQHMSTFIIGLGLEGRVTDADEPIGFEKKPGFEWPTPGDSEASRIDDPRHAAFNGRGTYFATANSDTLAQNFNQIFDEIVDGQGAATAVSFNTQEIQENTTIFRAFFNTVLNTGEVEAIEIERNEEDNSLIIPGLVENQNGVITGSQLGQSCWRASDQLDRLINGDPLNNRNLITYDRQGLTSAQRKPRGVALTFENVETLTGQAGLITPLQLAYLAGDQEPEKEEPFFRQRPEPQGLLGDIINSTPLFVGAPDSVNLDRLSFLNENTPSFITFRNEMANRPGVIYVGSNDGFLHAFRARDSRNIASACDNNIDGGEELFAFMPSRIITERTDPNANSILELTEPEYSHRYFVDLSPEVNDVLIRHRNIRGEITNERNWRSLLIGGLRGGGRGYFALDITDPTSFSKENVAQTVLWEFNDLDDQQLVRDNPNFERAKIGADQALGDLGFSFSRPTLTFSNSNAEDERAVLIFSNGYNSDSGRAVLYVLFVEKGLDGWQAGDLKRIVADAGPEGQLPTRFNGLSSPRAIDRDGNGTVDFVYAGDLFGNLYRFDLTAKDSDQWAMTKTVFTAGAASPGGGIVPGRKLQPITTQPLVVLNPTDNNVIVVFATGSYIAQEDGTSLDLQSLYGILDDPTINGDPDTDELVPSKIEVQFADLVEQQLETVLIPLADGSRSVVRLLSDNPVNYSQQGIVPGKGGWFIDFNDGFPGERAIRRIQLRSGLIFVNTVIPQETEMCGTLAGGFIMALDPINGGAGRLTLDFSIFDINNDGNFDERDLVGEDNRVVAGLQFDSIPSDSSFIDNKIFTQLSNKRVDIKTVNISPQLQAGRYSWREMDQIVLNPANN